MTFSGSWKGAPEMPILHLIACFFGGAALLNAVPHLVSGVMGRRFPSPFARPPGKGMSSALVNVLWGFANLAIAWLLLGRFGHFYPDELGDVGAFALGLLVIGLMGAFHFGGLNEGCGPDLT